jgi:hypothetical protein
MSERTFAHTRNDGNFESCGLCWRAYPHFCPWDILVLTGHANIFARDARAH